MDITPTTMINTNTTTPTSATTTPTTKSPEHDTETPTRINTTTKPLSFSNGVLKRHTHSHSHHHHHHPIATTNHHHPMAVIYKECLKNHAANLGGHALDGCGEFMPSPTATAADPSSIKCAACGCHRNFHRREPEEPPITTATHVIEYQPHHRHHPPPPPFQPSNRSPNSASPPPISSSYYPSAPHMLLALSAGLAAPPENTAGPTIIHNNNSAMVSPGSHTRKRFRTKFSQEQKEKMQRFAEKVGWKMQKRDEDLVQEFCNEIGVDRGVLKVWMHNNKNTFVKKDSNNNNSNENNDDNNANANIAGGAGNKSFLPLEDDPINHNNNNADINGNDGAEDPSHNHYHQNEATVRANGSSSS